MIKYTYFGNTDITVNGKSIYKTLSKKGIGILFYMYGMQKRRYSRELLASIFWSDYTKESSLNNLRFTLWKLRKAFKEEGIDDLIANEGKHYIVLEDMYSDSDYIKFKNNIMENRYTEAVLSYSGSFLEDFYLYEVPVFSDWVFNERAYLENEYLRIQLSLADYYAGEGHVKKAMEILDELIKADPLNEDIYKLLITYQYEAGNKVAAINTYRNLKQLLRNELNISPSVELQNLIKVITDESEMYKSQELIISKKQPVIKNRSIILYKSKVDEVLKEQNDCLASYKSDESHLVIDICDSPGFRVNYEGIFELLDDIENNGRYNPGLWKSKCEGIVSDIKTRVISEDVYLYQNLATLLNNETSIVHVIRIWNLNWLDDKTIDFISYLYRNSEKILVITGVLNMDRLTERIDSFIKSHEHLDEFKLHN
jgi:DNA-binding SARP family transcriptional activator